MSFHAPGLFKARHFGNADATADSAARGSFLADSTTDGSTSANYTTVGTYTGTELTKNEKYCVSRLPALPPLLNPDHMGESTDILNGYSDSHTKCALAVSEHAINVWPYTSTDDVPITFEFPLGETAEDGLQLAILTRPSSGTTLDPGLAIISSTSGHVCFFESVQYAPALGLINSKSIETVAPISSGQGEYITLAENVEPAGIAIATSWKRVVLISLRDSRGVTNLSTIELTKPSSSSRLFGWLGSTQGDDRLDDIVSIKSGKISNNGNTQEIVIQDSAGLFKKFIFQSSAAGATYVNHKKTLSYRLNSYLENNIDGLIPGAVFNLNFFDLWPVASETDLSDEVYITLLRAQSSMHGSDEFKLLLLTVKINSSGVLVLGSHQLPDISSEQINLQGSKPKLFIPKPGKTAFITLGRTVILSDLNSITTNKKNPTFRYYEPKWEDSISLKPNVQIIGYGYEDYVPAASNPAIILMTADQGIIRIERFCDDMSDNSMEDYDSTDPVFILKSHIQQAIYYGSSSVIDFDFGAGYSLEDIMQAIKPIIREILDSSSPYLPPVFPSLRDSFALRTKFLTELIHFVKRNFTDSWSLVLPSVVEALEKVEVCSHLWNLIDSEDSNSASMKKTLKQIIAKRISGGTKVSKDKIREFFTHEVNDILPVLTNLLDETSASSMPLKTLLKILVGTLHDAVYRTEATYILEQSEVPSVKLWLFDSHLLIKAEEIYSQAYCSDNAAFAVLGSNSERNELVQLTETLYYLVTNAIQYMQDTEDDQLEGYLEWYNYRKGYWINALVKHGLIKEALTLSEAYRDFFSVSYLLEQEREQTSPEYVDDKISYFMSTYGYDFASKFFDFLIQTNHVHSLLHDCKPYHSFLEKYFAENQRKSGKVAWIHYLFSNNFKVASEILISLPSRKEIDDQENREFHYSLAKLSALAAASENKSVSEKAELDEIVLEAENNLVHIRIQNQLHQSLSSFVQSKEELMTLDYFMKNFANPKLDAKKVRLDIETFYERFVDHKPLLKEQLITLLTSINPASQFRDVFADALTVAALMNNDTIFRDTTEEIWKKLICTTDDWSSITSTEEHSDDVNKIRILDTVMFSTMKKIGNNREIMSCLDKVLHNVHEGKSSTNDKWDSIFQPLVDTLEVDKWIRTIEKAARQNEK